MEITFITIIILFQLYFFLLTWKKIYSFKNIFTGTEQYSILRLSLLQSDLETIAPQTLLRQLFVYQKRAAEYPDDPAVSVSVVNAQEQQDTGANIVQSINIYLLRNSGATSDFNLVRDIADRLSDAVEEEIGSTLSVPLYLGLLGTLIGIVFGLSQISGISFEGTSPSSGALLDQAIPQLLGGVKVAMIASFTGLLLTVIHSGFFYRFAKAQHERRKHDFFTFIQVELLPLLNDNLNATLYSLQSNLLTFNRDFGQNIHRLDGLMNKNYDALLMQEQFMDTLSKMDIMEFASANVKVLNGLKTAVRSFSDFNEYVGAVNFAVQKTDQVIMSLNQFLNRTDNLDALTGQLLHVFEENRELMAFIRSHFDALDSSKQLIGSAVVSVHEYLGKALDELNLFTAEKIAAVRTIEIHEAGLMQEQYPERWKNLEELKKINTIISVLAEGNQVNAADRQAITTSLAELKDAVGHLENGMTVRIKVPSLKQILKGLFRKPVTYEKA